MLREALFLDPLEVLSFAMGFMVIGLDSFLSIMGKVSSEQRDASVTSQNLTVTLLDRSWNTDDGAPFPISMALAED
jgi:hypothetical protein